MKAKMEKNLTIRTASENLAEDLRNDLALYFDQHINFTWYEGAWQLGVEADEKGINDYVEDLKKCDSFKEGRFTITIE